MMVGLMRRDSIQFKSPAKVNLGLKVIKKRPDGYHEIETVMQMITLSDALLFEPTEGGIELICQGLNLLGDRSNLVYQAAELIREKGGVGSGVRIILDKRIPVMAGLGGGSSNAATTLIGLNRLWQLGLRRDELIDLARGLGADVPFFLYGPRAYAAGRGDQLSPLPSLQKLIMLLVKPDISIPTSWAYKALNLSLTKDRDSIKIICQLIEQGLDNQIAAYLFNDFEETIIAHYPIIGEIKNDLLNQGALGALMSGSGPTVFAIFPTHHKAVEVYQRYSKRKMQVFVVETIMDMEEVTCATE